LAFFLILLFLTAADSKLGGNFVTRSGGQLLLHGQPFRFTGVNIWNANSRGPNAVYHCGDRTDLAAAAPTFGPGIQVIRGWFFQRLATTPDGRRDWSYFDRTLAAAGRHNLKVIAVLGNEWQDCEGYDSPSAGYKGEGWYGGGYRTEHLPGQPETYRQWVAEVVSRYRNNDAIMLWQMVNEAEDLPAVGATCGSDAPSALQSFARDISSLIKHLDRNHLVGMSTTGSGQCGSSRLEYLALQAIPTLDVAEYHDYTLSVMPGDRWNGLTVRLQQMADLGKPLIVGEVGVNPRLVGGPPGRARLVQAKLYSQFGAGVTGALLWSWNSAATGGSDPNGYEIDPSDPALRVLDRMAPRLQRPTTSSP
jgi:mannan endo-1,4-beta-mannosidase